SRSSRMLDLHPNPDLLKAFRLGKLGDQELDEIENHVAGCDKCCRGLRGFADDSFVSLVRQSTGMTDADEGGTPAPGDHTVDQSETLIGDEPAIPHELLNHPRYEILEKLGQGGMGVVYKARHRLMNRIVALKVLRPRLLRRPASVERFLREFKNAGQLTHPNIVHAYDAEQAGQTHFLAMEYVPGISLARL